MPAFLNPLGALPARFRRQRVLIVGCGDIGLRAASLLLPRNRVLALTSSAERRADLRRRGIVPLLGNLDHPNTLNRLAGLAQRVLYLAPPPTEGWADPRMAAMVRVLRRRGRPQSLVYGSTSGVYGDCKGALVTETRPVAPRTPRALRRVDAESQVRWLGRSNLGGQAMSASILRIPGIYAGDRPGGTPRERLLRGTPVLRKDDDVFTNHIHSDDLARACVRGLWLGRPQRAYHVCDDSQIRMGDYFDLAAAVFGLPKPPRVARDQAQSEMPLMLLSFMGESRRLMNQRLKDELRLKLRYPTVREGLSAARTLVA